MRLFKLTPAAMLFLSACAMMTSNRDSSAYQAGYVDGCNTAMAESSSVPMPPKRNNALYAADADYRAGWAAGHADCRPLNGPPRL
jgi:hypothetical protein